MRIKAIILGLALGALAACSSSETEALPEANSAETPTADAAGQAPAADPVADTKPEVRYYLLSDK